MPYNTKICPETEIGVLLCAEDIPDEAVVTKVKGETLYVLKHRLKVYTHLENKEPLVLDGLFLIGDRGSVTQVKPSQVLVWRTSAEDFVDSLRNSWAVED